jgi:hypothetical protein
MISGIATTGRVLTAGHIWRASHNMNPALCKYGLTAKDVESSRNRLLMLTTIEDAFDAEQLCLFYNFTTVFLHSFPFIFDTNYLFLARNSIAYFGSRSY